MPNTASNKKRIKVSSRRNLRNSYFKAKASNKVKEVRKAITHKEDNDTIEEKLQEAVKALDKAASKKIIHKNTAARKKSRLHKLYQKTKSAN